MKKEGPCNHCGLEETPMWRNGPPSKPVLCNKCGIRWKDRETLDRYVPKHIRQQQLLEAGHSAEETEHLPSRSASTQKPNTKGLYEPNFKNIPKRKRSRIDPFILTPMERFHKQLYDTAHIEPEVFFKESEVEDMLTDQTHNMMFTPPETLLGAMLLGSSSKKLGSTGLASSSNVKTSNAYPIPENGDNLSPK